MSSVVMSFDDLLEFRSFRSLCTGGGEGPLGGGVIERRDILAPRDDAWSVSCSAVTDVDAGPLRYSSSLSQSVIVLFSRAGGAILLINCGETFRARRVEYAPIGL